MKTTPINPNDIHTIQDPLKRLLAIMQLLRSPAGCPWDRKQTLDSLKPYLIEEAYEAIDAIDHEDMDALRSELGDVLLQVVFQSQVASEQGLFDFSDVARAISDKLIHRHPHVFGQQKADTPDEVVEKWEQIKSEDGHALLAGIPKGLPALQKAHRISQKASRVGFDWPDSEGPRDKIDEELHELKQANDPNEQLHELGDVLFAVANYARHMNIDPEDALQRANKRFTKRFSYVEKASRQRGKPLQESTLEEMEALWNEAKRREDDQ